MKNSILKQMLVCSLVCTSLFIIPLKGFAEALWNIVPITNFDYTFNESLSKGSENWYSIDLKQGNGITIIVKDRINAGSFDCYLYDRNFKEISHSNNIDSGKTGYIDYCANSSDTYYIKVEGSNKSSGHYDLAVYNAWYNPEASDSKRDYYSSIYSARYIQSGNYLTTQYKSDFYRFTALKNSLIDLKVTPRLSSGQIDLYLYDSKGNEITHAYNTGSNKTGRIIHEAQASDLYYVKVEGSNSASGNYDLIVNGINPETDSDSDGLYDSAEYFYNTGVNRADSDGNSVSDYLEKIEGYNPAYTDITVSGKLDLPFYDKRFAVQYKPEDDTKYKMYLQQGQGVSIVIKPGLDNGSLKFILCDKDGKSIDYSSINSSNDKEAVINYIAKESETYWIKIPETSETAGSYLLGVYNSWFNSLAADSKRDYFSTFFTAKSLKSSNYLVNAGEDYYRFDASKGDQLTITLSPHINLGELTLTLYDGNYTQMNFGNAKNGETATITRTITSANTYYVKVSQNSEATGNYDLYVSGINIPANRAISSP